MNTRVSKHFTILGTSSVYKYILIHVSDQKFKNNKKKNFKNVTKLKTKTNFKGENSGLHWRFMLDESKRPIGEMK